MFDERQAPKKPSAVFPFSRQAAIVFEKDVM
jgi:hypothetical protein